jgi:hypothetical protein
MKAAIIMMMFCFMAWVSVGSTDYWESQIEATKNHMKRIAIEKAQLNQRKKILDQEKAEMQEIEEEKQETIDLIKDLNKKKQEDTKDAKAKKEQYQQRLRNSYSHMGRQHVFEKQTLWREIELIEEEIQKTTKKYDTRIDKQKQDLFNLNEAKANLSPNIEKQIQSLEDKRSNLDNEKKQLKEKLERDQKKLEEEKLKPNNKKEEKIFQKNVDANRILENGNQIVSQLTEQQKIIIKKFIKVVQGIKDDKMLQNLENTFSTFQV